MANLPPSTSGSATSGKSDNLTDRVAARVIDARLALERSGPSRPRAQRKAASSKLSGDSTLVGEQRETKSLQRVFREMGLQYRSYRSRNGGPVTPGLRDAAYRFRAEPTLASLVAVAAFLDELDLLT
jgi:hypothetical protein